METNVLNCPLICSSLSSPLFHNHLNVRISFQPTRCYRKSIRIRAASNNSNDGDSPPPPPPPPPSIAPPERVEIRFRRGSRKRSRQQKTDAGSVDGLPAPSPPKEWESMTIQEKAIELYMGKKGLLFWLNKFAYASIYIIIGAWILFRFVGPSLGLYQLDAPTLSPTQIFK